MRPPSIFGSFVTVRARFPWQSVVTGELYWLMLFGRSREDRVRIDIYIINTSVMRYPRTSLLIRASTLERVFTRSRTRVRSVDRTCLSGLKDAHIFLYPTCGEIYTRVDTQIYQGWQHLSAAHGRRPRAITYGGAWRFHTGNISWHYFRKRSIFLAIAVNRRFRYSGENWLFCKGEDLNFWD